MALRAAAALFYTQPYRTRRDNGALETATMHSIAATPISEAAPRPRGRPVGTTGPNRTAASPVNRNKPWYDDIVWWFASNPGGSGKQCAAALGKSEVYVNALLRSDFLQARLREVRQQRMARLQDSVVGAATAAVTKLQERVEHGPINSDQLIEATDTLLAACGLGKGAPVPQQAPQHVAITVSSSLLVQAREQMIRTIEQAPAGEAAALPAQPTQQQAALGVGARTDDPPSQLRAPPPLLELEGDGS